MKFFGRSTKIAGSLAAALMISAPLALAATPTFAADYHSSDRTRGDNDRHDGDRNQSDRHDNDRNNYRGNNDRDSYGVRHERMAFRHHGHWGYSHGHRMWIVTFHGR